METIRYFFRTETWRYVAATVIPVVLLTGMVILFGTHAAEERHSVRLEQSGTDYIQELYALSLSLHRGRLLAKMESLGFTAEQPSQSAFDEALAILTRLGTDPASDTFGIRGELAALHSRFEQAVMDGAGEPEALERLSANIHAIRLTVADRSTLILDPLLPSYHMMNLQVNRLPRLLDSTTRFLLLEVRLAAGESLSTQELARLQVLREAYHAEIDQLIRDMRAVATDVPQLAPQVTPFAVRMKGANEHFDRLYERWDRVVPASPQEVLEDGQALYRPGIALYQEAHNLLHSLLAEREEYFTRLIVGGTLGGLLTAMTVLYFITGYYRASRHNRASREEVIRQLDAIGAAQGAFIEGGAPRRAFEKLLDSLMDATGSSYGFMGDLCKRKNNNPCLHIQAATHVVWKEGLRQVDHVPEHASPVGHDALVARVLDGGEPLVMDSPQQIEKVEGLKEDHPPLSTLLAIPVFKGPRIVGMVAVANREDGYASLDMEPLRPLLNTFANVLAAHAVDQAAREAELALRDSLVRHRTVLETMVDALITIDSHGNIETFNSAAESMFGYSAQEITGKPISVLMPDQQHPHPEDRKRVDNPEDIDVRKAVEVRAVRKDSSEFPAELSVGRMQVGGKVYFSGIVRDLTERKTAEAALRESSEGMLLAQRIAHLGHWIWDVPSGNLAWSEEIYRIFGLDPEKFEATYDNFLQAVHPEDRERVVSKIQLALQGTGEYEVEHRVVLPDGQVRTVHEQGEVSHDPDNGEPVRMVGTVHDITERKQLEEELSHRVQELEASKREIQGFYHTLSHELKTPLTSAREFTLIIKDGLAGPLTNEQVEYLADVEESCNQMTIIINDLVDATRLETGKLAIDPLPVSVSELIERACGAVTERIEPKEIMLLQDIATRLPRVVADPHRITQVLSNLLTNAIKFTPENGEIEISAAPHAEDPAMVALTVRDSGRGMTPEQAEHVFQRFYQIEKEDSHTHQGLGLGLYICSELVQLHGGVITVDSTPGKGSAFTFTLPAEPSGRDRSSSSNVRSTAGRSR